MQLKADNEKLRRERPPADPPSDPPPLPPTNPVNPPVAVRLVFVPRDRKCPSFSGKSGISIDEWVEEAQACMHARHLTITDQAFF